MSQSTFPGGEIPQRHYPERRHGLIAIAVFGAAVTAASFGISWLAHTISEGEANHAPSATEPIGPSADQMDGFLETVETDAHNVGLIAAGVTVVGVAIGGATSPRRRG